MNRMKKKLRSQSGASITFALLLFLVCAVLSSVVIVAATASAGRMSGIVEMDQSYYSVTSACELLKELLSEKMVAVVKVTTNISTTPYNDGFPGETDNSETFIAYIVQNKTEEQIASMSADELLTASKVLSSGVQKIDGTGFNDTVKTTSLLEDTAYLYYQKSKESSSASGNQRTISLETDIPKPDGVDKDPLAVTIEEKIDNNGNVAFLVSNDNGKPYGQELQFVLKSVVPKPGKSTPPDEEVINPQEWQDESDPETVHTKYTIRKQETKIQYLPLTWDLTY